MPQVGYGNHYRRSHHASDQQIAGNIIKNNTSYIDSQKADEPTWINQGIKVFYQPLTHDRLMDFPRVQYTLMGE
jgi:hypothetical protein